MVLHTSELQVIRRSHTGLRGFLDLQDASNTDLTNAFDPVLQRAGTDFELHFANALEAGKFAVAAELKVRESHRLALVGRAQELSGSDVPYNAQAVKTAERAVALIRSVQGAIDHEPLVELREVHHIPEAIAAIDDAKEALTQHLAKFNMGVEDFKEVIEIWDECAKIAADSGVDGLIGNIDTQLSQFITLRGEDDRGTRPHSPLPWWKWCIIAWAISSAIFAVIACFWWGGCTWVWAAIGAVAPWIFGMIDRGC
jgi:hypothetical protein